MVNTAKLSYYAEQKGLTLPREIVKRDGSVTRFDVGRIERAVASCYSDLREASLAEPTTPPDVVTERVCWALAGTVHEGRSPDVEQVQNLVEVTLLGCGEVEAARSYMAYRDGQAALRASRAEAQVPPEVREAFELDAKYFPTEGQRFMFYDKYSRFSHELGRRETFVETTERTVEHLKWELRVSEVGRRDGAAAKAEAEGLDTERARGLMGDGELAERTGLTEAVWEDLRAGILHMDVMPSMRLLAMAGEAVRRDSMSLYNCSYIVADDVSCWPEALLISMAGCGVGFSVEREWVERLPRIQRQTRDGRGTRRRAGPGAVPTHVVADSTDGWAVALRTGLAAWWAGDDVQWDTSLVREKGSVLRVKGGRASGPEPLREMLDEVRRIVLARAGSFLRSIDAYDLFCCVGECAVAGGVRRTAMLCLFDWDDEEMRAAKRGAWGTWPAYRANANNSAVWPEDISDLDIVGAMYQMITDCNGEPGIFSRANAVRTLPEGRNPEHQFGTNPCGEIILRPYGLCNLSQAVCRPGDTEADLTRKVRLATLAGKLQSLSTRFPGMRPEWAANAREERLLGVDLTAQNDCEITCDGAPGGAELRERLQAEAVAYDAELSEMLGIPRSASITCNKPAGNSTELLGAASNGIHRPHASHFLRRMIVSGHGPLARVMRAAGVPMELSARGNGDWVAEFPKAAPAGAPTKNDASAIEQLEFWLLNKEHWTSHNPSCTITYRYHEVVDLIGWVCQHKDRIGGLSFFPASDHIYPQAPFEEITEAEHDRRVAEFPTVDYSLLYSYEHEDMTTAAREVACLSGRCET